MVARSVEAPGFDLSIISVPPGRLVNHPASLFAAGFFPIFAASVPDRNGGASPDDNKNGIS
jgi:hypothetical protein